MLQNDEFTKDLFRFLQLLCEGHNGGEVINVLRLIELHVGDIHTYIWGFVFVMNALIVKLFFFLNLPCIEKTREIPV